MNKKYAIVSLVCVLFWIPALLIMGGGIFSPLLDEYGLGLLVSGIGIGFGLLGLRVLRWNVNSSSMARTALVINTVIFIYFLAFAISGHCLIHCVDPGVMNTP